MILLLLGANLGDRIKTLHRASELLADRVGDVAKRSAIYETAPWGVTDQPTYLNQVLGVETTLPPDELLRQTQAIEQALGRVRLERWGARLIDIDMLYYDQLIIQTPQLTIPHPYLHQRRFTLVPLAEIAPNFLHPILQKKTLELLTECTDTSEVKIFNS
ncbi:MULTISPECIES: 2-amino-4-hydroxy-6-hydroxymethyldihydropteridine diphosphokinase [unclassified Spirosoma]|uniref:2-amino-4-hydroxy-6- hydroxymethyldihydropteridine diphosphokinase n=1 Tax=unclassified Spirosoma TaxID=2621999 RepID=UPI0009691D38|nr:MULTISPECIES: 2-amino-4-hydroxy-6-hydroxymethyldihydropteridine diphosphokinase [unclassified Spirosoma]MBN8822403.1 2-amino-4-hydroxy-6-hydroxymethyldihydropteridine diphosphokinase [Spirosoma sp.]OJW73730.1 MAG: 2-amino-4-hydroxy-6-hydroxymethyldihydropteridine diphosphokinase [Spirosoma sp. 48-14]